MAEPLGCPFLLLLVMVMDGQVVVAVAWSSHIGAIAVVEVVQNTRGQVEELRGLQSRWEELTRHGTVTELVCVQRGQVLASIRLQRLQQVERGLASTELVVCVGTGSRRQDCLRQ